MIPTSFSQENVVLSPPKGMETDVEAICAHVSNDMCITCWKITKEEIEEFQRTGKIWLIVWSSGMAPVSLTAKSPFRE